MNNIELDNLLKEYRRYCFFARLQPKERAEWERRARITLRKIKQMQQESVTFFKKDVQYKQLTFL